VWNTRQTKPLPCRANTLAEETNKEQLRKAYTIPHAEKYSRKRLGKGRQLPKWWLVSTTSRQRKGSRWEPGVEVEDILSDTWKESKGTGTQVWCGQTRAVYYGQVTVGQAIKALRQAIGQESKH
jgi:hypothetical protein